MTVIEMDAYNPDIERALFGIAYDPESVKDDGWFNMIRSIPESKIVYAIDDMRGDITNEKSMHVNIIGVIHVSIIEPDAIDMIQSNFDYKLNNHKKCMYIDRLVITDLVSDINDVVKMVKELLTSTYTVSEFEGIVFVLNTEMYDKDTLSALIVALNNFGIIAAKYNEQDILFIKEEN